MLDVYRCLTAGRAGEWLADMLTLNRILLAGGLFLSSTAGAAGLGQMNVLSSLGQPLQAEIEVLSVRKEDANTLLVRLASPDAYREANVPYGAALRGLSVGVVQRPDGRLYVRVVSSQAVNEPFLSLLVELNWPQGRLVRQYVALLDPPEYASGSQAVAPAVVETRPLAAPRAPATAPVAAVPVRAPAGEYGPVKRGETLSRIAASVKREGVSLEQMLIGILRANPDAFINGNVNLLKAGATLRIPGPEQLAEVPQDQARKEVRVQTTDWSRYRRKVADTAGRATEKGPPAGKRASVRVKEGDEARPKDVLKLSSGQPPGGKPRSTTERIQNLEEELVARDRALNEANARIRDLEKAVKDSGAKK
jgi:pilus assembly protein FimV